MACVAVIEKHIRHVDDAVEKGDKLAGRDGGTEGAVQLCAERVWGRAFCCEGAKGGLKVRHEQGGAHACARYVGYANA